MTLLYFDEKFAEHDPGKHPESPQRMMAIQKMLQSSNVAAAARRIEILPATDNDILRIHTHEHLNHLRSIAAVGGGSLDADTIMSTHSLDVATLAAGSAVDAVQQIITGEDSSALCLSRPPGHHATPTRAMGFCLFNNVAIAAQTAIQRLGVNRVLIVDWDVHHGNGTQDAFYADQQVTFFSAHRFPFYPGSGTASETGTAAGLGTTVNLPLPFGIQPAEYLTAFENKLTKAADRCRPEIVILSAGFDAHTDDPIGSLGLQTEHFETLTQQVMQVADTHANGRLISVLEGGYHVDRLAECVDVHLRTLLKQ